MKTEGHVLPRDFKVDMPTAVRGEGIYIYDDTGKRYLDGCSGALISRSEEHTSELQSH